MNIGTAGCRPIYTSKALTTLTTIVSLVRLLVSLVVLQDGGQLNVPLS